MSEFGVEAVMEIRPSSRSLREAKATIEDEIGDLEVDITATVDDAGGGGGRASRDRAMSRRLQDKQLDHLRSVVDAGEENLELDQDRNTILREMLETMEAGNYAQATDRDGGKPPRGRRGRDVGLGLGALGVALLSLIGSGAASGAPTEDPNALPIPPEEAPGGSPGPTPVTSPNSLPRGTGLTPGDGTGTPSPTPGPGGNDSPMPNIGPEEIVGGAAAGASAYGLSKGISQLLGGASGVAQSVFSGAPAAVAAGAAKDSQNKPRDQQGWLEKIFGDAFESTGVGGASSPAAFINMQSALETGQNLGDGGGNRAGERQRQRRGGPPENINVNVTLEGATERDVRDAMEKAKEEAVNEVAGGFSGGGSGSNRLTRR